ncbi:hypothetical protein M2271_008053 [Streptomyces sp. LBL]|nr:hypothetical protein [Streptomyces sp. LBL]MDH6630199.1 hypothetical protein [Streptomyces sp. LBL]
MRILRMFLNRRASGAYEGITVEGGNVVVISLAVCARAERPADSYRPR